MRGGTERFCVKAGDSAFLVCPRVALPNAL